MSSRVNETAQQRQQRLLAQSHARLERITGAAKGEGRVLSDTITAPPPIVPPTPVNASDDPAEVDLSSLPSPRQQLQSTPFSIPQPSTPSLPPPNPFPSIFPGMTGGVPGAEGAGGGDFMAQLMASINSGGGAPGMEGMATGGFPGIPTSPIPLTPKTKLDKLFPILHLVAMLLLASFAVGVWEPAIRNGNGLMEGMRSGGGVHWSGWGELGGHGSLGGVRSALRGNGLAQVPLFWMFITLELILQTTRLFLTRSTTSPPTLLSTLLPLLSQFSPAAALTVSTGFKYFGLAGRVLDDLAVLVLFLGMSTVVGGYWGGGGVQGFAREVEKVVTKLEL